MKRIVLSIIIFVLFSISLFSETTRFSLSFNSRDIKISHEENYIKLDLTDGIFCTNPGSPALPHKTFSFLVDPQMKIEKITVVRKKIKNLRIENPVMPMQKFVPIMKGKKEPAAKVGPDQNIYNKNAVFPHKKVRSFKIGYLSGQPILSFTVTPFEYNPKENKLTFSREMEIIVHYNKSGKMGLKPGKNVLRTTGKNILENILENSNEIDRYNTANFTKKVSPMLPAGDVDYVIITDASYVSHFQPLADWKTKKGIPTRIYTTTWIYANYTGIDNPEKIRNFIIDSYTTWGIRWVLLGGDTAIIPEREAYAMTCGAGFYADEDDIPCDLYYSDLDGNWDADDDGIYGEIADSIDMHPEVYVGRAPADTTAEVDNFVDKVLSYEKPVNTDYHLRMNFIGGYLDAIPTDGGIAKDTIETAAIPDRFKPINKLYDNLSNLNYTNVMNAWNQGQGLVNHNHHCNESLIGIGAGGTINISDIDSLTNTDRYTVLYTIGCWAAALDRDSILEHYVVNASGGGFALANSRYGWYSPGSPGNGPSDVYDKEFFVKLFGENIYHIGETLAVSKLNFIASSQSENAYRWVQYCLNTIADPEMPIYTDTPQLLTVTEPASIFVGNVPVNINIKIAGMDIDNALVCIRGDNTYSYGYTDAFGNVTLSSNETQPSSIEITATAQNGIPYESNITVIPSSGPFVQHSTVSYDDDNTGASSGNTNGEVNPNETIEMYLTLENYGISGCTGVSAILSTSDTYISFVNDNSLYNDLPPDATSECLSAYVFSVDNTTPDDHPVNINIEIHSASDSWTDNLSFFVVSPELNFEKYALDDDNTGSSSGNDNEYADRNEIVEIPVTIKNNGGGSVSNVSATLTSTDPYINITVNNAIFGDLASDATALSLTPFVVSINSNAPSGHQVIFDLNLAGDSYVNNDTFMLTLGTPSILLVDDDNYEHETYFINTLNNLNKYFDIWDIKTQGIPSIGKLQTHKIVLWTTAVDFGKDWTVRENNLKAFLDNSGKLYLASQDYLYDIGSGTDFSQNYLHISNWTDDTASTTEDGILSDPISDAMALSMNYPFPNYADDITPDSAAVTIFTGSSGNSNGLRVNNLTYRLVFTAFPFEAVPNDADPNNQAYLLNNILSWLAQIGPIECVSDTISDDNIGSSSGNDNGIINPGEAFEMQVTLKNKGEFEAETVTATLSTTNSYASIIVNNIDYGNIASLVEITGTDSYVIQISTSCPNSEDIDLVLNIGDSDGNNWIDTITKTILFTDVYSLSGMVYDLYSGIGIPDATVTYSGPETDTLTASSTGYYEYPYLQAGTYTVIASKSGYNSSSQAVTVPPDAANINFNLTSPEIDVSPTYFEKTVAEGQSTTDILTIYNNGDSSLDFSIMDLPQGVTKLLFTTRDENENSEIFTCLKQNNPKITAAGDMIGSFSTLPAEDQPLGLTYDGEFFWLSGAGNNANPNYLYKFDRDGNLITSFAQATTSSWGWRDLAWDGNYLYASDDSEIDVIDPADGSVIRTFTASTGLGVQRALCYDGQYLWTANWGSTIYQIDLDGNVIKTLPNSRSIYGFGWDNESEGGPYLWATAHDGANSDTIYKIDPDTGNTIETFAGYGSSCGGCAFVNWNGTGSVWDVDQGGDRVVGVETYPIDVSWLLETPDTGTVPAGSSVDIIITFDATDLTPDTYTANIVITNNDPDENPVIVPVTMYVLGYPNLVYNSHTIDDDSTAPSSGNGDGAASPGETTEMHVNAEHTGHANDTNVTATLSPSETDIPSIT